MVVEENKTKVIAQKDVKKEAVEVTTQPPIEQSKDHNEIKPSDTSI